MHEDQVEPAAELRSDLAQQAGPLEAEPLVQPKRCGIGGVDSRHHDMLSHGRGELEQRLDQFATSPRPRTSART